MLVGISFFEELSEEPCSRNKGIV